MCVWGGGVTVKMSVDNGNHWSEVCVCVCVCVCVGGYC